MKMPTDYTSPIDSNPAPSTEPQYACLEREIKQILGPTTTVKILGPIQTDRAISQVQRMLLHIDSVGVGFENKVPLTPSSISSRSFNFFGNVRSRSMLDIHFVVGYVAT
jgi:hypothetical protein